MHIVTKSHCWEATVTGSLQTGGFQTGLCNFEKSALSFISKQGVSTLSKSKKNIKEGNFLKV